MRLGSFFGLYLRVISLKGFKESSSVSLVDLMLLIFDGNALKVSLLEFLGLS